jgi:hypothetical protein
VKSKTGVSTILQKETLKLQRLGGKGKKKNSREMGHVEGVDQFHPESLVRA